METPCDFATHSILANSAQAETIPESPSTEPARNPPVDRIPSDFEAKWQEFLAKSVRPSMYGPDHKYLCYLGYIWGQDSFFRSSK